MVIFHSYVSLPEGIWEEHHVFFCQILPRQPINFSKLTKATEHLPASFAGTGIGLGMWTIYNLHWLLGHFYTYLHVYIYIYMYMQIIFTINHRKPSSWSFLPRQVTRHLTSRFQPAPTLIKQRIEKLIEREHLGHVQWGWLLCVEMICTYLKWIHTYIYIYDIWYMIYHDIMIWYYGFWGVLYSWTRSEYEATHTDT